MHFDLRLTLFLFAVVFFSCSSKTEKSPKTTVKAFPATIGVEENSEGRYEYEFSKLADPKTGTIPYGIREKELSFAVRLPEKGQVHAFRKAGAELDKEWASSGPFGVGGRTRALAYDVRNTDILLAGGASGRMYRSEDFGSHWMLVGNIDQTFPISCLVQDTRNGKEDTWYFGTGEISGGSARGGGAPYRGSGIFRSTDNGKSWSVVPSTAVTQSNELTSNFQYVHKIIIDKTVTNGTHIYAACVGGIMRSTDAGQSWQQVLGSPLHVGDKVNGKAPLYTDIVQCDDGTFYASIGMQALVGSAGNQGLYRSLDGANWGKPLYDFGAVFGVFGKVKLESIPDSDGVYALVQSDSPYLFKYEHSLIGRIANLSANLPGKGVVQGKGKLDFQKSYNMVIKVMPSDPSVLFIGGTNLYRSDDGFSSPNKIYWIGGYDTTNNRGAYPNHFPDQHELTFLPGANTKALSANDGGIFSTSDITSKYPLWSGLNNGYITAQFYSVDLNKDNKEMIVGGMQDNGSFFTDNTAFNSLWSRLLTGDGGHCRITRGNKFVYVSAQYGIIYRFDFNGGDEYESFTRVDPKIPGDRRNNFMFIAPFELDPNNQNIMYMPVDNVIWRNDNLAQIPLYNQDSTGVNWNKITSTAINDSSITALAVSSVPENIVFFGTEKGTVYRIDNANSNNPVTTDISSSIFDEGAYVSSIALDPANADEAIVVFSNYNVRSLFYSKDGGKSYTDIGGNLEEANDGSGNGPSIRWAEIVPMQDGTRIYYVGTSVGLFSTKELDGANTVWEQEGKSVIGNSVVNMVRYSPATGKVIAASHGNGLYTATVSGIQDVFHTVLDKPFRVEGAYPNPFDEITKIPFQLSQDGWVKAVIYNTAGQRISTIANAPMFKGENSITWDGTNYFGNPVSSGLYICRVELNGNMFKSIKLEYNRL